MATESARGALETSPLVNLDIALDPMILVDLVTVDEEVVGVLSEASHALSETTADSVLRGCLG